MCIHTWIGLAHTPHITMLPIGLFLFSPTDPCIYFGSFNCTPPLPPASYIERSNHSHSLFILLLSLRPSHPPSCLFVVCAESTYGSFLLSLADSPTGHFSLCGMHTKGGPGPKDTGEGRGRTTRYDKNGLLRERGTLPTHLYIATTLALHQQPNTANNTLVYFKATGDVIVFLLLRLDSETRPCSGTTLCSTAWFSCCLS